MIKIWREKKEITKSHKHSTVSFIALFKNAHALTN